jgi:hypothetical protein
MKQTFSKIAVLLLLPAFLITSTGNVLGDALCIGDDGHVEIEFVTINGCGDGGFESSAAVSHEVTAEHQSNDEHCGSSCLDVSMPQSEATAVKRLGKIASASLAFVAPNIFPSLSAQSLKLVVSNLASQPPPRISQTILAHRTIVLLT